MKTGPLYHGGVMVNYRCTAACRHCLYACSPTRDGLYMSGERARQICELLNRGNIGSVHIGGGEPFLDFEGLLGVIGALRESAIRLDYIETNAFWAAGASAAAKIEALLSQGVEALCISIDPYHAEYVPYHYPLLLAKKCDAAGLGYFLWKREFLSILSPLDGNRVHGRAEMEEHISGAYIRDTAAAYGLRLGGRAVNIEEEYGDYHLIEDLTGKTFCGELLSTGHFHVDPRGYFIPPGCTGLRIPLAEAVGGIPAKKYPVFEALYRGGLKELLGLAKSLGFTEDKKGYPSQCNLCFQMRAFLARNGTFPELDGEHYQESRGYYYEKK
jgi:hypothetical protein